MKEVHRKKTYLHSLLMYIRQSLHQITSFLPSCRLVLIFIPKNILVQNGERFLCLASWRVSKGMLISTMCVITYSLSLTSFESCTPTLILQSLMSSIATSLVVSDNSGIRITLSVVADFAIAVLNKDYWQL